MSTNLAIRRKIEQSRVSVSSYPKLAVVSTAFAREAASRIRSLFNTDAEIKTEANTILRAGRYLRSLPALSVLGVLEVDGVPNSAALHFDAKLVHHLVDLSMGGDPALDPPADERSPTMIDLSLCRRFADSVLIAFDNAVRTTCAGKTIGATRCVRFETQPQMAAIAPERSEVMVLNLRVEIGEARRSGFMELVLPLSVVDPIKTELMQRFGSPSRINSDLWDSHLRRSLMQSRLDLDAVVDVHTAPLSFVMGLKVGDVLKLGRTAQDPVELSMETERGRQVVAACRLGSKGTQKALKVLEEPSPELIQQLMLEP
jgi:flagellar motor switch protein FliM